MHDGDRFLGQIEEARKTLTGYAFAGDTARCLWMLDRLPVERWKKWARPWPRKLEIVSDHDPPHAVAFLSQDKVAQEFGPSMLRSREDVSSPALMGSVPLVAPPYVLAQLLLSPEPLIVTQIAGLLRCLPRDFDLESVRILLKAVGEGERYETLRDVACAI